MKYVLYDAAYLGSVTRFYPKCAIAALETITGPSACNTALTFWLGAEALTDDDY